MGTGSGSPIGEPNWQDFDSYDDTEALMRDGWAWQFLRRNPAYRAEWREASDTARHPTAAARWGLLTFCPAGAGGFRFLAFRILN